MDTKIQTVQDVYAAFGRGDVEAILAVLTDDVDWASEPESSIAPWHGVRRGKAEVPSFFVALAEGLKVTEFTPLAFTSSDTDVMAVIRFGFTVLASGRSGEMDLHHWWRFRDGRIAFYRGTEDTALTAQLLTP
ncbi:nuclear transport factor 2 family protein [Pseudonocardia sp.]|uniref:nuclear transport factor 2 family protein n=1 Tax=Pseudonocardia sp. TaxID=60912 RepID=UPI003D0A7CD3